MVLNILLQKPLSLYNNLYILQSNLYNPMLHGTADLCWITQDVRLSSYLHNLTLATMSDYTEKLLHSTHNTFTHSFDNKQ